VRGCHAFRVLRRYRLDANTIRSFEPEDLPPLQREPASGILAELAGLGFRRGQGFYIDPAKDPRFSRQVLEYCKDGEPVRVQILWYTEPELAGRCYCRVLSTHSNGMELVSTQHLGDELLPPSDLLRIHHDPDTSPLLLLQRHRQRVAELVPQGLPARLLSREEAFARFQQCFEAGLAELKLDGSLREHKDRTWRLGLVPALRLALAQRSRLREAALRGDNRDLAASPPGISAEALLASDLDTQARLHALGEDGLSQRARSWLFLGGSLALALVTGWQWNSLTPLWLALAILLHELGHLTAMGWLLQPEPDQLLFPFPARLLPAPVAHEHVARRHAVILLAGPLPGLLAGLLGLAFTDSLSADTEAFLSLLVGFNALCLLPPLPLEGGRLLDLCFGARHPKTRPTLLLLSAVLLFLYSLVSVHLLPALVGLVFLLLIPAEWRLSELLVELRKSLDQVPSEEDARKLLLPALRRAHWPRMDWPRRMEAMRELQSTLSLPAFGWNTKSRLLLAYTSPLWLGLAGQLALRHFSANQALHAAQARAELLGIDTISRIQHQPARYPENGAQALESLRPELPAILREGGLARVQANDPRGAAMRQRVLQAVEIASQGQSFHLPPSSAPRDREELDTLLLALPRTAARTEADIHFRRFQPAQALELGTTLLRFTSLARTDGLWCSWEQDRLNQFCAFTIIEEALSMGAELSEPRLRELQRLLDEDGYLAYSSANLAAGAYAALLQEESLREEGRDAETLASSRPIQRLLLALQRIQPTHTLELVRHVEECIDTHERMQHLGQDGFDILLKADDGSPYSGRYLHAFMEQVALRRQALTAIIITRQRATNPYNPRRFSDILALGWHGAPINPATGDKLEWKLDGLAEVLRYPSDNPGDDALRFTWRLPPRRSDTRHQAKGTLSAVGY
jgi:hypothetical protein